MFFFEALWLVNVNNDARMIEYGKNFLLKLTDSEPSAQWAKLWVKSIKTLFEFVAQLFNLDEAVLNFELFNPDCKE